MIKLNIELKDKKQIAAVLGITAALILFMYVRFLLLPQISGVAKWYNKAKKMRVDVKAAEKDIAGIPALKKEVGERQSKIQSYERMLPAEQEMPRLLEDLSEMAQRSGVKIVGITPLNTKQQPGETIYQEKPILINAKSGYHELGKFLASLENSDRFMKVVDIHIKENKATPRKHDVELLVLTYVLLGNPAK